MKYSCKEEMDNRWIANKKICYHKNLMMKNKTKLILVKGTLILVYNIINHKAHKL